MRLSYKQMQAGSPSRRSLSPEQIGRLDALGFEWSRYSSFEERLVELAAFKVKHGHCNAPQTRSSQYVSLGVWCSEMRASYKRIQQGKTPRSALSQDQIERLDALSFEWVRNTASFEEGFAELAAFKAKYGHCNAPPSEYKSLVKWCRERRYSYKHIQEGKTPHCLLSRDQIRRLEALGFRWKKNTAVFEKRLVVLLAFKGKHGHCNVPQTGSGEYRSLNRWCNQMRTLYKKIQEGETPVSPLLQDQIRILGALDFEWSSRRT